jgi:hypothetical protein
VEAVESTAVVAIQWIELILELTGAVLVGIGASIAVAHLFRSLRRSGEVRFTPTG